MATVPLTQGSVLGLGAPPLWWRMIRLRADLAASAGSKEEARLWYDRAIDLWANADDEMQPELTRMRAARAALQTR